MSGEAKGYGYHPCCGTDCIDVRDLEQERDEAVSMLEEAKSLLGSMCDSRLTWSEDEKMLCGLCDRILPCDPDCVSSMADDFMRRVDEFIQKKGVSV